MRLQRGHSLTIDGVSGSNKVALGRASRLQQLVVANDREIADAKISAVVGRSERP